MRKNRIDILSSKKEAQKGYQKEGIPRNRHAWQRAIADIVSKEKPKTIRELYRILREIYGKENVPSERQVYRYVKKLLPC